MRVTLRRLLPDHAAVEADGSLSIAGCRIDELAAIYGTPLFVYDEDHLRARCREAVQAFGRGGAIYAAKAFLCKAMARLAHEEGMLLDVATGGELHVARAAGVPADSCVLHGNNKHVGELRTALDHGIGRIVVDSFDELDRLDALHRAGCPVAKILLRIAPGVHAHTHQYMSTGQDDSKFGFNLANGDAMRAIVRARRSASVDLLGLHCHIGSGVLALRSFGRAADVIARFAAPLGLPELILGGGLGVAYVEGEEAPSIAEWAQVLHRACALAGVESSVSVEPGRAIVAAAAVTVYTIGTIKEIPGIRTYVAVDGGMSDNLRPALYGSRYECFLARSVEARRDLRARVVGKHCESGDVIAFDAALPNDVAVDDLLVTPVTGAYGHSMASNYNKLPRPPVAFASRGAHRPVVRRETHDDLLCSDLG